VISSLGGLLFGYDTDIIYGNVLSVRNDLGPCSAESPM
jgi:hypothetical protein